MVSTISRQATLALWAQMPILAVKQAVRLGNLADVKPVTSAGNTSTTAAGERGTVVDVVA